jgi:hypothetical protein
MSQRKPEESFMNRTKRRSASKKLAVLLKDNARFVFANNQGVTDLKLYPFIKQFTNMFFDINI